jgi:AcrR family transcriptional regulator
VSANSEEPKPEEARHGGRARDPQLDAAITRATRELLEQRGVGGLTLEAIARRAGVGRATIYRRWPNRDALLSDLLRGLVRDFPIPDRGDVREELIELLNDQLTFLRIEAGKLYPSLAVHAGVNGEANDALWEIVLRRRAALLVVLQRGVKRHQIRPELDLAFSYHLIWGPVYYRYLGELAGDAPIEPDFITKLVDSLLVSIGTSRSAPPVAGR